VDGFFRWVEQSELSMWLTGADTLFAFPGVFTLHVVSILLIASVNFVFAFGLLGLLPQAPGPDLARFGTIFWIGLALNIFSGVLLVIAFPTKTLTNPVFYFKLTAIALGVFTMIAMRRTLLHKAASLRGKSTAIASLLLWGGAIAGGQLLAYTYSRWTVDFTP